MKFHPYAEFYPLIEGADFDVLVADIKEHGLNEKIWLYDGRVIDGRNRFLACQKAKVKPEYRQFRGSEADALAFVTSANDHRRHLTASQRAMAASRIKEAWSSLKLDSGDRTEIAATSQKVSRASVFHADKVRAAGSKDLQRAVDSGDVSVARAAAVVELPKPEQLAAAKAKPEKKSEPDIERFEPEEDEGAQLEQAEKEYTASIDKVMAADDKLAAAHAEIKRQAAEIASLKLSRNGFQNKCEELIRRIKGLQRQNDKLKPNGHHGARAN